MTVPTTFATAARTGATTPSTSTTGVSPTVSCSNSSSTSQPMTPTNGAADTTTDFTGALKALRAISHAVACKAVHDVPHNQWVVAGISKSGISAKKVNDRIHYVKSMVSALNRAESTRLELECRTSGTGAFAMANGATFSHVKGHSRAHRKLGWNQGASRAGGRDKKMMMAEAFYGDMDLECDRLFTDQSGDVRTVT